MLVRMARAYGIRPGELNTWEYWTEYVPAMEQICEVPLVDEMISAMFRGKSKGSGSKEPPAPMRTKEERRAAFERLQREAELRKNGRPAN